MKREQALALSLGDRVSVRPHKGGKRSGTVNSKRPLGKMITVQLDGDPFPVYVEYQRASKIPGTGEPIMPTTTPTTKELRRQAKAAGVEGWADMERDELLSAVDGVEAPAPARKRAAKKAPAKRAPAKRTTAKKAPAKKAPAKRAATVSTNGDGVIPWREGSNMHIFATALMQGGKRSALVKKLAKKVTLKPRKNQDDFDEDFEIDRRLLITGQILQKDHGWSVEKDGRGRDATIKATPPS